MARQPAQLLQATEAYAALGGEARYLDIIRELALEILRGYGLDELVWLVAKNTIAKMVKISKAKADPADYAKALTDFASAAADEATRNFAGLAEVAKKAQTDSTEILMAAGKNAAEQASAAVQKATDEAAKAAKKASVAAR